MKIDFEKYKKSYIDLIANKENDLEEKLKEDFMAILQEPNLNKRSEMWEKLRVPLNQIQNLKKLANPFYIGFGNPESDILFIGKEKAFNITANPRAFLNESINNIEQWNLLSKNKTLELEFNPQNPARFYIENYNHKIKGRDTWGFYKEITNKLLGKNIDDSTLFENCFSTEINHIPSKKTKDLTSSKIRHEFLKSEDFYKTFKYVIIGAKGSVSIDKIQEIFNAKQIASDFEIGKNKTKTFSIDIFLNDNGHRIVLCNQLSGAAGWTNDALAQFIKKIKDEK